MERAGNATTNQEQLYTPHMGTEHFENLYIGFYESHFVVP
jgi:hypothetical protein